MWACFTILAVGLGLRVTGALGDLWLDEIRTLGIVAARGTVTEIIWGPGRTNNHFLNSLYILLVGPDASPLTIRGFSVLSGTLSVAAAGLIGLRQGRVPALINMTLISVSFMMVLQGSEARGYGAMVLFYLIAVYLVDGALETEPSGRWKIALVVISLAGLLSHLLFTIFALFPLAWWVFFESTRPGWRIRSAVSKTLSLFFWTVIVTGLFVGSIVVAWGGRVEGWGFWTDPHGMYRVFGRLYERSLGFPDSLPLDSIPIIVAILTLLLWLSVRDSVSHVEKRRTDLYAFHLAGVPLLIFAGGLYSFVFPRLLILTGATYLLFLGQMLGNLAGRSDHRRLIPLLLLPLFILGNGTHLVRFFKWGRGSYAETVALITVAADSDTLKVGATHPASVNRIVFDYHLARSPHRLPVQFVDLSETPEWVLDRDYQNHPTPCPEMYIVSPSSGLEAGASRSDPFACPKVLRAEGVQPNVLKEYRLFHFAPHGGSGWNWKVYRAVDRDDRLTPNR